MNSIFANSILAHELEDDRLRRRDETCFATGVLGGGTLGALVGIFVLAGPITLTVIGAVLGAYASRVIGRRISADDWDPPANHRPYVGTPSPDDDITRSS
jgi:uncharacterized membrane protein